jgi:tRNA uridine 5-carboxymethylaminomethyl modification enzyme
MFNLVKRPDIEITDFLNELPSIKSELQKYKKEIIEQAGIEIKYQDYILKEEQMAKKMSALENLNINHINYDDLISLSAEGKEKLKKVKPQTIGQASRISGVSPSDISILMVYLGR